MYESGATAVQMAAEPTKRVTVCVDCDVPLRTADVLIEYEPHDGRPMGFAECPMCAEIYKVRLPA